MPSPFPGMDPYIESQPRFHTFHPSFIAACAEVLNQRLPAAFYADVDERVQVDVTDEGGFAGRPAVQRFGPDVGISSREPDTAPAAPAGYRGVATLEPVTLPHLAVTSGNPTQKLVEIRGLPDDGLVTTVELLSPANKTPGPDRDALLAKRTGLLRRNVNLVDVDLLLGGPRLPLTDRVPAGDYHAIVTRANAQATCEVYSWSVRDALPTVAVPMRPDLADVPLDLAAAFALVYDRYRFERQMRYDRPLSVPLAPADLAWAVDRAAGHRPA